MLGWLLNHHSGAKRTFWGFTWMFFYRFWPKSVEIAQVVPSPGRQWAESGPTWVDIGDGSEFLGPLLGDTGLNPVDSTKCGPFAANFGPLLANFPPASVTSVRCWPDFGRLRHGICRTVRGFGGV